MRPVAAGLSGQRLRRVAAGDPPCERRIAAKLIHAGVIGIKPKRLENIENGWQKMHDEDFEKVCSVFEEFSRWVAYEGPVDRHPLELKVADSAQKAAVYLVKCNPDLLKSSGVSWRSGRVVTRPCWMS